jgi:predicted Rossmann fold nucleotide-binding protein DprA/Smf involved in DNA uptake
MITIISGGQTGVDRAALDVALELGIECGGWCPKGRLAEDGVIPKHYPLRETKSAAYPERTRKNVVDSDGTLIVTRGEPKGGTALTIQLAQEMRKPSLVIDLLAPAPTADVRRWLHDEMIALLNVAGPRESEQPGIHAEAMHFLWSLFDGLGIRRAP